MQLKVDEKETGREWTLTLSEMECFTLVERLMKAEFGKDCLVMLVAVSKDLDLRKQLFDFFRQRNETQVLAALLTQRFELGVSPSVNDLIEAIKLL